MVMRAVPRAVPPRSRGGLICNSLRRVPETAFVEDIRHGAEEEPLTAVCRAVTQAMGFDIPTQVARSSRQTAGILERFVRCSGAPAREVTRHGA